MSKRASKEEDLGFDGRKGWWPEQSWPRRGVRVHSLRTPHSARTGEAMHEPALPEVRIPNGTERIGGRR